MDIETEAVDLLDINDIETELKKQVSDLDKIIENRTKTLQKNNIYNIFRKLGIIKNTENRRISNSFIIATIGNLKYNINSLPFIDSVHRMKYKSNIVECFVNHILVTDNSRIFNKLRKINHKSSVLIFISKSGDIKEVKYYKQKAKYKLRSWFYPSKFLNIICRTLDVQRMSSIYNNLYKYFADTIGLYEYGFTDPSIARSIRSDQRRNRPLPINNRYPYNNSPKVKIAEDFLNSININKASALNSEIKNAYLSDRRISSKKFCSLIEHDSNNRLYLESNNQDPEKDYLYDYNDMIKYLNMKKNVFKIDTDVFITPQQFNLFILKISEMNNIITIRSSAIKKVYKRCLENYRYHNISRNQHIKNATNLHKSFIPHIQKCDIEYNLNLTYHQKYSILNMLPHRMSILQKEVGLGKTRSAIAYCLVKGSKHNLIVTEPGNIKEVVREFDSLNMKDQVKTIAKRNDLKNVRKFNVTSYNTLSKRINRENHNKSEEQQYTLCLNTVLNNVIDLTSFVSLYDNSEQEYGDVSTLIYDGHKTRNSSIGFEDVIVETSTISKHIPCDIRHLSLEGYHNSTKLISKTLEMLKTLSTNEMIEKIKVAAKNSLSPIDRDLMKDSKNLNAYFKIGNDCINIITKIKLLLLNITMLMNNYNMKQQSAIEEIKKLCKNYYRGVLNLASDIIDIIFETITEELPKSLNTVDIKHLYVSLRMINTSPSYARLVIKKNIPVAMRRHDLSHLGKDFVKNGLDKLSEGNILATSILSKCIYKIRLREIDRMLKNAPNVRRFIEKYENGETNVTTEHNIPKKVREFIYCVGIFSNPSHVNGNPITKNRGNIVFGDSFDNTDKILHNALNILLSSIKKQVVRDRIEAKKRETYVCTLASKFGNKFNTVILDEVQNIKNHTSIRTKSVMKLRAKNYIMMSATPISNKISEVLSYMLVGYGKQSLKHRLDIRLYKEYRRKCYNVKVKKDKIEHVIDISNAKSDYDIKNLQPAIINSLINKNMTRVSRKDKDIVKDESFDFDVKEFKVKASPSVEHMQLYAYQMEVIERAYATGTYDDSREALRTLINLTKISEAPHLISNNFKDKLTAKQERIVELVSKFTSSGRNVIVFSQFIATNERITPHVVNATTGNVYHLKSNLTPNERYKLIDAFRSESEGSVILGTVNNLGKGYNLGNADVVIMSDIPWSPILYTQSIGRMLRPDQKGKPEVFITMNNYMIDMYKFDTIMAKLNMIHKYVEKDDTIKVKDTYKMDYKQFLITLLDKARTNGIIQSKDSSHNTISEGI